MSIVGLLILAVVIAGLIAVLRAVGVPIPANIVQIIWIVLAVVVAIWAIRFIAGQV